MVNCRNPRSYSASARAVVEARSDPGGPLDLGRVAADLGAPLVEDPRLVGQGLDVAEGVPDVGVAGHHPQRLALAAAADDHRDAPGGRWVQPAQPLLDGGAGQRRGQPRRVPGRAELVPVLVVVPARTSRRRCRGSADRRTGGRRCAPCRRAAAGCGTSCTSPGPRSRCARSAPPRRRAWSSTRSACRRPRRRAGRSGPSCRRCRRRAARPRRRCGGWRRSRRAAAAAGRRCGPGTARCSLATAVGGR